MDNYSSTTQTMNGQQKTNVMPIREKTPPNPEALPKPKRRTFSAEYKRRIVREADQCNQSGQVGALLRREGLYSSHLTDWRRQLAVGRLDGTNAAKRGRKPRQTAEQKENERLQRENERLAKRLAQANLLIEAQKKVGELLDLINQKQTGTL